MNAEQLTGIVAYMADGAMGLYTVQKYSEFLRFRSNSSPPCGSIPCLNHNGIGVMMHHS